MYQGELGRPFVFSGAAFDDLRQPHGDKAVWKTVDREPATRVARIVIDDPRPRDIDTWDGYQTICASFEYPALDRPNSD
jgi:molybdenum cofactor cytidylyltransferase